MIEDLYSQIADLQARVSRLESKNIQFVQVYATTTASKNTNINSGSAIISFNNALYNLGTLFSHSTVTNDTRITINRNALVMLHCTINSASAVSNIQLLYQFRVNGSTVLRPFFFDFLPVAGGADNGSAVIMCPYQAAAGDYVEVRCTLSGAAGTATLQGSGTSFWAYEIFQ